MSSPVTRAWLTTQEAGEYTSTSKRTILRWIADGLPCARIHANAIRIKVTDLDNWMERFVDRGVDIDAQVDKAWAETKKQLRSIGIACKSRPRKQA